MRWFPVAFLTNSILIIFHSIYDFERSRNERQGSVFFLQTAKPLNVKTSTYEIENVQYRGPPLVVLITEGNERFQHTR